MTDTDDLDGVFVVGLKEGAVVGAAESKTSVRLSSMRQQFLKPLDGIFRNAAEDVAEPGKRINGVLPNCSSNRLRIRASV